MALTPEQKAELMSLEAKFGNKATSMPVSEADKTSNGFEAPKQMLQLNPGLGAAMGALNKTRETISQPILRMLAKAGYGPAKQEMNQIDDFRAEHKPVPGERAGEIAADVGIGLATGGEGLVVPAIQFAAQHQLQNYSKTGEVKPGEAAIDAATGVAVPYVGGKVGPIFKATGKRILENVVKPVGRMAGTKLEPVLASARGVGKYLESMGAMKSRVSGDVAKSAENRLAMMRKAGVTGDFPAAAQTAEASILSRNAEQGQRGLIPGEKESALNAAKAWEGITPNLNADELQGLIQKSDDVAYQSAKDINLAPQQTYSRELGRALRGQRQSGVDLAAQAGKISPEDLAGFESSQQSLRDLKPALDAIEYRAKRPNYSGSAIKHIPFGVGPLLDLALTRPGTANLAYDIGKVADADVTRQLGRRGVDLARSAYFGRDK